MVNMPIDRQPIPHPANGEVVPVVAPTCPAPDLITYVLRGQAYA